MNIYYVILNLLNYKGNASLDTINELCFNSIADKRSLFKKLKEMAVEGWIVYDLANSQFSITDKGREYMLACQNTPIDIVSDYRNIDKHQELIKELQEHIGISKQNNEDTTINVAISHILKQELAYVFLKKTIDNAISQCYNEHNIDTYDGLKRMVAEILFMRNK